MKDLLRITYIKENLCKVESSVDSEGMGEELSAALLGAMAKSKTVCAAILAAAVTFFEDPEEVTDLANRSTVQFMQGNGHTS